MSVNLLEIVQQNLGYPELQKMDPNTQLTVADLKTTGEEKFNQAAIPAILTGLFKYAQSDEGAADILQSDNSANWITKIFDGNKKEVILKISIYASKSPEHPIAKMNAIANEAVKVIKENLGAGASVKNVRTFLNNQKNNILLYLPATLNIGELLHEDSLDDATNKMEGPVSSLIRSVGDSFSGSATAEISQGLKTRLPEKTEQNI
jgi:hypothetical protein